MDHNIPIQPEADIQELTDFLVDFATSLLSSGAYTARVARNVTRIATSFGYNVDMSLFQRNITMTVTHPNDYSIRRTYVRKLKHKPTSFQVISKLSALSWKAFDYHLPLEELKLEYNKILTEKPISRWIVLLFASIGNASFCRLFGGDIYAVMLVFIGTLSAFFIRQELLKRHTDLKVMALICSFMSSMITAFGTTFGISSTPDIAIAASVLFLIPGVPLINSIIDTLEGNVLSGLSRGINSLMIITAIALGLYSTLIILGVGGL